MAVGKLRDNKTHVLVDFGFLCWGGKKTPQDLMLFCSLTHKLRLFVLIITRIWAPPHIWAKSYSGLCLPHVANLGYCKALEYAVSKVVGHAGLARGGCVPKIQSVSEWGKM